MTDDKGDFRFLSVEVKGGSAYLTVNSSGKFDGFRRVPLLEDKLNYTRVLLKEKVSLGRLSASQGGELSHNSEAVISLPANGIVDATGQSYSGDYNVFMSWIDPTSEDLNLRMVGDLSAIDSEGELVGLSTYGMLQVELEAEDGSELNLSEGSTAVLEFPVPQSIRANAPTEIPLWNYNEANGYWVEEGSAVLDGDKYVGEVSHFSTWNVDVEIDPVDIWGSIVTSDLTKGLSYFQVRLGGDSFQGTGGWLCDDGSFRFINVPSGEVLTLEILNYCGEIIETINLGPYEPGKIELGSMTISDDAEITFVNVKGNGIDCNNNALTEGLVTINFENDSYSFPIESDGSFDFTFPTCAEFEANVQVFNITDLSTSIFITLSDQTLDYNLENIQACEEKPEEYYYFKAVDEKNGLTTEKFYTEPEYLLQMEFRLGDSLQISGHYKMDIFSDDIISVQIPLALEENVQQLGEAYVEIISPIRGPRPLRIKNVAVTITSLGSLLPNGYYEHIEGFFEGNYDDSRVNANFRVKG